MTRRTTREDMDRAAKWAAAREKVRVVIATALAEAFGPDNATHYEDEPNHYGVSVDDSTLIDVEIGWDDRGAIKLAPRPEDSQSLLFFDGIVVSRIDTLEPFGGTYDRRTRALMRALLDVALAQLDDMDNADD